MKYRRIFVYIFSSLAYGISVVSLNTLLGYKPTNQSVPNIGKQDNTKLSNDFESWVFGVALKTQNYTEFIWAH